MPRKQKILCYCDSYDLRLKILLQNRVRKKSKRHVHGRSLCYMSVVLRSELSLSLTRADRVAWYHMCEHDTAGRDQHA